jgi:hypothetical protein
MILFFFYKKQTKNFFISSFILLTAFLMVFSLFWQQRLNSQQSLAVVLNWKNVLGRANIKNLLLIPVKFAVGRLDFYPKWFYYLVAGLWTSYIWFFVFLSALTQKRHDEKTLIYLLFFPLGLGTIVSFFTPLLQYFRFLYLAPILALILSLAIDIKIWRNFVLTGMIIFSLVYLIFPRFHREDWKSLAGQLSEEKNIYMIYPSADALRYYKKDLKIIDLREIKNLHDKEIIVIPYTAEIYGFDYQKILLEKKYFLKTKKIFRGVFYEIWAKTTP